jgi:predicted ATPase
VLVILEDAHWADPTTLDLFDRIIHQFPKLRGFLIVTYRPEFKIPWDRHPHVTGLLLNRLGQRDCRIMVDAITHGKTLPAEVMEQIISKTDGIPLFVEELTKNVLESGLLKEKNGALLLTGPLPPLAIPATLQDSLMARLDRLSAVKDVAQIGAAIGREFSFELLAAVSSMRNTDLQDALAKLEAAELVFSHGAPPNTSYIFKHALVQDAAYETLLKSRRQQLHARIAQVLETRFAEVAAAQPEIVAHHYTNAGLAQVAVNWWRKAGEVAIKRSANPEAIRHLNRAIDQVQLCPESRERDINELAIRISLSGPLIATRGYVTSELANNYARASELCTNLGEDKSKFPVMYGQWVIPYVRGDMAAALRNSEMFLRRAEQQDDVGLLMMGHRIYGSSLVWRGDVLPGSEHLQRALSMFQSPAHDHLAYVFSQHPRTAALAHLCLALQHLGHLDQAMAAGCDAISQAKRIEHFNSIAYALCFVSLLIMLRRDVKTLKRTAGELLQLASQHNASYWLLWAKPMMGWIAAQEGETESGIAQMHESTVELQRQQANLWVPQTLLLEAEIFGQAKEYGRAHQLLAEAQALIEPLDQRFYEAELHRVRGVVVISDSADLAAGVASLDRAIEVARRQNAKFLELRATVSKARFLVDQGLREEACNLLAPVYGSFSEGFDTVDLREARCLLDEPR